VKEDHKLQLFSNKVPLKIFGLKEDEVNEEFTS
jgi:hypothetical protein